MTTVDQLNQELVEMKDAYDQLETERQNLLDELQKQSIAVEQNQMRPITGMFRFDIPGQFLILVYFRESSIIEHVERRF